MSLAIDNVYKLISTYAVKDSKSAKDTTIPAVENEDKSKKEESTKKAKRKNNIIKQILDNYCYIFSVDEDGHKTLIQKISLTKLNHNQQQKLNVQTDFTNPIFNNENVIKTKKSAFNYNQQLLRRKNHSENSKEIMDLLMKICIA